MADIRALLAIVMEEIGEDDLLIQRNLQYMEQEAQLEAEAVAALVATLNQPEESTRIEGYVERVIPLYSEVDFRSHFRMGRPTFEDLCEMVAPFLKERSLSVEKKMLSTLWILCNQETFRGVADRFDLSKGTLHMVVLSVVHALNALMGQSITFPQTRQEMERIAEGFRQRAGIRGVVGAVDGTHIQIPAPNSLHRSSYINRKGFASMQLQVVCDSKLRFLDICTGYPGSVHDARVYRNSPLSEKLETLPDTFHILGDSAYPLTTKLVVPFRDDGHLDRIKKRFNKAHGSTRVEVERAIGLLKGRFRRLKYLDMLLINEIPFVISSCCVLHNLILEKESDIEDVDMEEVAEDDAAGDVAAGDVAAGDVAAGDVAAGDGDVAAGEGNHLQTASGQDKRRWLSENL